VRPDPALEPYLELLDEAFSRKAWHGPNLRGSLRGLQAKAAAWRPGRGCHNVWELAVHAAYWKYAVRRMLTGEKRGTFPIAGSNWFVRPARGEGEEAWRSDLALLAVEHRRLRAAVAELSRVDLTARPRGSRYTIARLVQGAAAHDLYHAGQIQLLKRLGPRRRD
jgi:uncharacterized damage-inducible protein DinB